MAVMRTTDSVRTLVRLMPAFGAGVEQWAAWWDAKAEVFTLLALRHRTMAAEAQACAVVARQRAGELREGLR